ncbi:MAG TPA: gamma-glutamyltransferase family protein [Gaiellaceae bacterium]|nr:gamma-glutamyltransferase family protein [Gaiellaceae bacterium]
MTGTFTTRPELRGTFGMVASTHWLASAAAMAALERGGNAFDAAVTAGFVLQVVEPHMNGPGGEAPILFYSAERDEVLVVAGQGVAPAAATTERFRELGLELVPGTGLLPACVPGAFDAWLLLLRDFGSLSLAEVLEPAIGYAERGYPLVAGICDAIARMEQLFRQEWPGSAELYLPVPAAGDLFRNRDLAATWRRVLEEARGGSREQEIDSARDAFYRGFVAEAIASFAAETEVMDSSGRRHRGLLTGGDLASWQAALEPPVERDYHGWRVFKTGPWGQGPVFLQQLGLLERFDLGSLGRESAGLVHVVVECAKLAFADREAWYGDPGFFEVPLDDLLSPVYAEERARLVGEEASGELRPGGPGGREPRLPRIPAPPAAAPGTGEPGRGDTCHVDVVDRHGNLVSATPSGGWLDGSPVIPGLGFCLGTRGQMFWLEEGLPSSLEPRKRPRTTLSPTIARRDGETLAFGTPGGDQQDQWSLVFFLSLVHFGLGLQEAIDAPMFHTEHFPESFYPRQPRPRTLQLESRFGEEVVGELSRRGHLVEPQGPWSLGRLSAAATDGKILRAAANPRGMQGYAVGR